MHHEPAAPKLRLVDAVSADLVTRRADQPVYQPTIQLNDIFREMIRTELRNGRLSAWRRRRIVQYAAQLNLSAVEAGRLIVQCRDEALSGVDPLTVVPALHLGDEPATWRSLIWNVAAIVVGLAMILVAVMGR